MRPLRDIVAEAIRGDGSDLCDQPWEQLPADKKIGWLGDADRAIAAVSRSRRLADILRVAYAAQAFVDECPSDDAGSKYLAEGIASTELEDLVYAVGNLENDSFAWVLDALKRPARSIGGVEPRVKIEAINIDGANGRAASLYINDYRVAGPKPLPGPTLALAWTALPSDLNEALSRPRSRAAAKVAVPAAAKPRST